MSNKLITGLNPDQQRELVCLLRENTNGNNTIANAIEGHLSGNSAAYNDMLGESPAPTEGEIDSIMEYL